MKAIALIMLELMLVTAIARGVYYVVPNFSAFDVKLQVVHAQAVPFSYIGLTTLYGVTYIALVLVGAAIIFSKRDFK